ncbi:hypothetical protein MYX76_02465 [Desulfobacterota bacterium AH_259_B03_O07]|nr:hypothetical protein [Desulfobacterota bacterium AH_259_B03_O07]
MSESIKEIEDNIKKLIEEQKPPVTVLREVAKLSYETQREPWLRNIERVYDSITLGALRNDLKNIESERHQIQNSNNISAPHEVYTRNEEMEAERILNSPNILEQMLEQSERAGYVGETINKVILFLAIISSFFDRAISCTVKGPSSAGKSALVGVILKFFPKDILVEASILTPKALYHYKGTLSHKVLHVFEREGSKESDYPMRTSLSEGKIVWVGVAKDEATGEHKTQTKEIPAEGLVILETTTERTIHPENETRVFTLNIDDSDEQTKRVLKTEAKDAEGIIGDRATIDKKYRIWRCAYKMLNTHEVKVPFADELARIFPTDLIRARRDFPAVILLIKTRALVHQMQREKIGNKLIAQYEDLEGVKDLILEVLKPNLTKLTSNELKVLEIIKNNVDLDQKKQYSTKDLFDTVKNKYSIGYSTLKSYLGQFCAKGLMSWNSKRGAGSQYDLSPLADSPIFESNLLESLNNLISKLAEEAKANSSRSAIYDEKYLLTFKSAPELALAHEDVANFNRNQSNDFSMLVTNSVELDNWLAKPSGSNSNNNQ